MIAWTLTLSGQQIALLKMFSQRKNGEPFYTRGRERELGVHPNTIPGTRSLLREGLLEYRDVKTPKGYTDTTRAGHFITRRGAFILKMIEQDFDKFLRAEDQVAAKQEGPRVDRTDAQGSRSRARRARARGHQQRAGARPA